MVQVTSARNSVGGLVTLALTLYGTSQVSGQADSFFTTFGEGPESWKRDYGYDIGVTSDGHILGTGYTQSYDDSKDAFIWQSNSAGELVWMKRLIGPSLDRDTEDAHGMVVTSDDGGVIVGSTNGFIAGNDYNNFITRFNATGDPLWTVGLGEGQQDYARDIDLDAQDNVYVTGYSKSYDAPNSRYDLLLTKLNSTGGLVWIRMINGTHHDYSLGVVATSDGGVVTIGTTRTYGIGSYYSLLLTKFDSEGNLQFSKAISSTNSLEGFAVTETSDGGIAMTGYIDNVGAGFNDIFVAKSDALGNPLWAIAIGNTRYDIGYRIIATSGGGVIVTGSYYDIAQYGFVAIVCKVNATGSVEWSKIIGGMDVEYGLGIALSAVEDIFVTGHTASYGAGAADVFLAKMYGDGGDDCFETITPQVNDVLSALTFIDANATVHIPDAVLTTIPTTVTTETPQESTVCIVTARPTDAPSFTPTHLPSSSPSQAPSEVPTPSTTAPSRTPSDLPTPATNAPSQAPSMAPSAPPTTSPSDAPSLSPSFSTDAPTHNPTSAPSRAPSNSPSSAPSLSPSLTPSVSPTVSPTAVPSLVPSTAPSQAPSSSPSVPPSYTPTHNPSVAPTSAPTNDPTGPPTHAPTASPTNKPTLSPTLPPTIAPTSSPTKSPSSPPTAAPTHTPTASPIPSPTSTPLSSSPTDAPSLRPTIHPTSSSSANPTNQPSDGTTASPTRNAAKSPTKNPVKANQSGSSQRASSKPFAESTGGIVVFYVLLPVAGIVALVYLIWNKGIATTAISKNAATSIEIQENTALTDPDYRQKLNIYQREDSHGTTLMIAQKAPIDPEKAQ